MLADPELKGTVVWNTRVTLRRSGHRPDIRTRGGLAAVEVELQRKDTGRMEGILTMYRDNIDDGKLAGVVYVCGSDARADRVHELANKVGIPAQALRIELLSDVREQTQSAAAARKGARQAASAARAR